MTIEEMKALPTEGNMQAVEAIREDFRDRFERMELSPAQKALLDCRRERVAKGETQLLDWDIEKGTIGKR